MHIVCPHCTTSYAINPATLGSAGRNVRCSRCKEIWLARAEDAVEPAVPEPVMAEAGQMQHPADAAAEWDAATRETAQDAPLIDSPSIAGDFSGGEADWRVAQADAEIDDEDGKPRWFGRWRANKPPRRAASRKAFSALPVACAVMGALAVALMIWRTDVVRLLPQTASFYRMVGLDVNLRGLLFKDLKVSSETVEGKPVLVIEGRIVATSRKTMELPRLRFSVRDAKGSEIYAWNSVLEQTALKPGEHVWFKSRLASPPAEGRSIDVRFFNWRDVAGGSA